jgi:hypothetical protein
MLGKCSGCSAKQLDQGRRDSDVALQNYRRMVSLAAKTGTEGRNCSRKMVTVFRAIRRHDESQRGWLWQISALDITQ